MDDPDHAGRLRLHRFAEFTPDGNLILRGDANSANDSTPVAPSAVHGVAVLRVPFVGLPIVWFAEKNWAPLAGTLAAVAALTLAAASGSSPAPRRDDPEKPRGRPGQPPPGQHRKPRIRRSRRPRGRARVRGTHKVRALLALAAIPLLASLMTSATAHASFSAATPTQTSSFSALASFPCQPATPLDSPDFFYRFNEGSGTVAADASLNARNGTLHGHAILEPGSCSTSPSPALTLGGSTESAGYVSTASSVAAPTTFSVEIWFKAPKDSGTSGKLIGFGDAQTGPSTMSDRHLYMTDNGKIVFGTATPSGNKFKVSTITSNESFNNGGWHQATATMSKIGNTITSRLYIDGIQLASDNNVDATVSYSGYWRVGYDTMDLDKLKKQWPGTSDNPVFAGTVDNAAVYPTALTPAQVKAHYDAGR